MGLNELDELEKVVAEWYDCYNRHYVTEYNQGKADVLQNVLRVIRDIREGKREDKDH